MVLLLRNNSCNYSENTPNHQRTQLTSELQLMLGFLSKINLKPENPSLEHSLSPSSLNAFSSPKPCLITLGGLLLLLQI